MNYLQHALDLLEDAQHDDYSPAFQNAIRTIYAMVERADYLSLDTALSFLKHFPQIGNFRLDELICSLDSLMSKVPFDIDPVNGYSYSAAYSFWECRHFDTIFTKREIKTGLRKAIQCKNCGRMLSTKFTHAQRQCKLYDLPVFDEGLKKEWDDWRHVFLITSSEVWYRCFYRWRMIYPDKYLEFLQIQDKKNQEWWDRYSSYLDSYEWKEKRQQKLDQARGLCERCGEKATEVHHLSYRNIGDEPLGDLMAICYWCHHQEHGTTPSVERP